MRKFLKLWGKGRDLGLHMLRGYLSIKVSLWMGRCGKAGQVIFGIWLNNGQSLSN